jgi:enoyl-CoA hydratase
MIDATSKEDAMAPYECIALERLGTDERIARITLNRPAKVNALSLTLFHEFRDCLKELEADHQCRVVIVAGAGRGFSAGYDLSPASLDEEPSTRRTLVDKKKRTLLMEVRTALSEITDIQLYFWNMAKVTIAQIHGPCLAGGCELAMMADLVVAADDAQIGHPGLRGLGTARNGNIWPLVMGMRKAKELYYTGDSVSGTEAAACGMINHAWPADELEARTLAFAERVANLSSDHLAVLKTTMNRFYENMGIYSSMRSATDLDALAQLTEHTHNFHEQFTEGGLKHALRWRDEPYRKGRNDLPSHR